MKKINIISTILVSTMIITAQLNAADQPSPTDAESNITALQKELADTTNDAADNITKEIIEKCNVLKKQVDGNISSNDFKVAIQKYDTAILQIEQNYIKTADEINTKLDKITKETEAQTSYKQKFITGIKNFGSYALYPLIYSLSSGYTNQQKALANKVIDKLKEQLKNKDIAHYLKDEIDKQKIKAGLSSTMTQKALMGLIMLKMLSMDDPFSGVTYTSHSARGPIENWSTLKQTAAAAALLSAVHGVEKLLNKK
jgi:hypothetical protein